MNVLIIEDEIRATNRLERVLKDILPEINIVAKLETIKEATAFFETKPSLDVVFSDIQLADGLSFEIYEKSEVTCPIIFTTAFNQYAIEAFNTNGIDYLLKPVEKERLEQSIQKLKQFTPKEVSISAEQLKLLSSSLIQETTSFKKRFVIKVGSKIKSIPTEEIQAFYSQEKGTYVFTNDKRNYSLDFSLSEIKEMLDPTLFFQTSRKHLVSINSIAEIVAFSNSRLKIKIDGFEEEIIVARERVQEFKKWLDN